MSDSTKAVFLSYASQDAEAAKRICEALRAADIEVWFDADGGLEHGDEWDAKIRRQIKECVLFIAVISANTQAREEGYFRIEWELAAERAMGIASGVAFLLPIVIDGTREPDALVPDRFRKVQWTRLPDGNVTPEVQQRFLKLWSHRTGVVRHSEAKAAIEAGGSQSSVPVGVAKSPAGLYAGIAGLVLVLASVAWWRPWEKPVATSPAVVTSRPEPSAVAPFHGDPEIKALLAEPAAQGSAAPVSPLTPARELAVKARGLFQGLDATREDFALAEDYCQRALKLDPADGEVWAAYAQLHSAFGYRGWDTSAERREQNRVMAERAIRLAPDSVQAKLAQVGAWASFGLNRAETEKLLREVIAEQPGNQPALRFLAVTVLNQGKLDECLALNERSAALPGGDPLALFNNARYLWQRGRRAETYATMQRSLAQKPFSSSLTFMAIIELVWRGDVVAAAAAMQQIPQSALLEDRTNYTAGLLRFYQRRADEALAAWGSFPRDYYADFAYDGPKGLLIGLADEMDHREAAAKIEWRTALALVEKRIAAAPNKPEPYYYRAYLLACLGEKAPAEEALRTCEELTGLKYPPGSEMAFEMALVYARLGRFDEIFDRAPSRYFGRLRIDPRFDAVRADPRYAKLLAADKSQPAGPKK